jgi:DNA ligase-1
MSKRSTNTLSSTPKKKAKTAHGQHSLDKFFGPPSPASSKVQGPEKGKAKASTLVAQSPREVIDVDLSDVEEFAPLAATKPLETASAGRSGSTSISAAVFSGKAPQKAFGKSALTLTTEPPTYAPLDVDPPFYALEVSPWLANTPTPYSFIVHALTTLTATRSRISIIQILTNTLRAILRFHSTSLLPALHLLSNSLASPYLSIELGLGPAVLSKAIQHVSGFSPAALKQLYNKSGDPGDVAFEAKSNVRTLVAHPPLLVTGVYDSLLKIAHTKGQGAAKQKQSMVEKLLVAAKGEEIRFIVRTLTLNLRVGAVRTSILTALARALVLTPPSGTVVPIPDDSPYADVPRILTRIKAASDTTKKLPDENRQCLTELYLTAEALLKGVYVRHPNYAHITAALCEAGLDGLSERVSLTVGTSLHSSLYL